eukprot:UN22891
MYCAILRNDVRKIYHPLRSRIVTNAFCQDNHQQIRLYCAISLLNHSCFPNIYHTKDTTGELYHYKISDKRINFCLRF